MSDGRIVLRAEALRSRDAATFTGSYQTLGAVLANPSRILKITNNSTVDVTVSYNGGTTDQEYVPTGTFLLIDNTANAVAGAECAMPKGTQVSIKGSAGTGNVYLSTYYVE